MRVAKVAQQGFALMEAWLPPEKMAAMSRTWAEAFRRDILPMLVKEEKGFARFYSADHGAPNKPVAVLLGLHMIDSTHLLSNMKVLRRLGLFVKAIEGFLKRLGRLDRAAVEALPKRFRQDYLEREGYLADAKSSQARHRLDQCARDLWYLIDRFRGRAEIAILLKIALHRQPLRARVGGRTWLTVAATRNRA